VHLRFYQVTKVIYLFTLLLLFSSLRVNAQLLDSVVVFKTIVRSDSYEKNLSVKFSSYTAYDKKSCHIDLWHWTEINIENLDSQYIFRGDDSSGFTFWHMIPVSKDLEWVQSRTLDSVGRTVLKVRPCIFGMSFGGTKSYIYSIRLMGGEIDCYQSIQTFYTDSTLVTKLWKDENAEILYSEVYSYKNGLLEQVNLEGARPGRNRKYIFTYDRFGRMRSIAQMHKSKVYKLYSIRYRGDNSVVVKSNVNNTKSKMKLEISDNISFTDLISNNHSLFYFDTCPFQDNLVTWLW